ncbi:PREDICTED: RPM1-interacting protein 4-like [Nicotiana attenuata]|uniref:Rpm1-interacting protein 4 n=1 Tax=Nicotiana attenuata TaxID=49451 RepID=A0A1J6JF46_NICAT|nr:PREDICTED: RPM1-interacting protein 4-like [Nicotiana attenuata]OIT08311.1 rpm1-interacting protein 4 [Nicotiana attenuata]
MARPNVPKFGNWENDDNTPYTVYFEKARQTRGTGKIINPNDPEENPDMFPNLTPPPPAPSRARPKAQTEEPIGHEGAAAKQTREHRLSKEDGDFRQYANSPARNENTGRRASNEHQRGRGPSSGRTGRQSAGSEHSFDKSPLHPHYQAKVNAGRGVASPAWEGKNNSYDSSHGTPGRSFESAHATPGRSKIKQESPDRGAAVPRFGEWDENDPQSADNYTHIFNKVREERQLGTGNPSGAPSRTSYNPQREEEKRMKCCFPW